MEMKRAADSEKKLDKNKINDMKKPRDNVLDTIVEIEITMAKQMNTDEPLDEKTLPAFKRMRWMTYSVFSDDTLALLLNDWIIASKNGRNVMIEKYAMMGGQLEIPDFSESENEIKAIVEQEAKWQEDVRKKYPKTISGNPQGTEGFKHYLNCDLHTWSMPAIHSYYEDIGRAIENEVNLSEARYNNLYASLGKGSLAEVEKNQV
jgi:hypothetical protein